MLVQSVVLVTILFSLLVVVSVIVIQQAQAQQLEGCPSGTSVLKDTIDNPPDFLDENTIAELQQNYEDSLRSDEIANYIAENRERLDIPDFISNIVICAMADDVQQQEEAKGVKFTGEELDTNIRLVLLSTMGSAAANVLENP